jgi:hypothetical protein
MLEFLRAFLGVFVATQFLMLSGAKALSGEKFYARLLTFEEAQEVLHCPWCTHPALENATYIVRTAEDLNIAFADLGIALNAAVLLNIMADAQSQCDRTGYDLAFDEYAVLMGISKQKATQEWAQTDGVFALLYPHCDLSPLAEYVVPPFRPCGVHRYAGATGPKMRWSWR